MDDLTREAFNRKRAVCILPDSDLTEDADVMRAHLKYLYRNIQKMEDETGSQYCYLGFPFLEGHVPKYIRGPLALFPASLTHGRKGRGKRGWYVEFTGAPIPNHTLLAYLRRVCGYDTTEDLAVRLEDAASPPKTDDPQGLFLERLSELLAGAELPLDSPDARSPIPADGPERHQTVQMRFGDGGIEFEHGPADGPERHQTVQLQDAGGETEPAGKGLSIANHKIIGSFPQGESAIYRDYEDLIERAQNHTIGGFVADVLGGDGSSSSDAEAGIAEEDLDVTNDADLNLIMDSDPSQDLAVLSSQRSGMTLVRGPPGTGKS